MASGHRPLPVTLRVLLAALVILLVPGFFQGCAGCTCEECFAQGVAESTRREAAKDYVYSAPLSRSEEVLRERLEAWGYLPLPAPLAIGKTVTVGRPSSDGSWLRVEVARGLGDRYRLHLFSGSRFTADDGGVQDTEARGLDLEWEVASRVDPALLEKTNAKAGEREERAKSIGRGCDRGCELGCRACEACDRHLGH